jgi:sugar phosphate isomerase/epimerase
MAILSINETTTFRWSLAEDVERYAAAGVPAIGVWRQKLADCGPHRAGNLIEAAGLKVSCLFWAGGFTGAVGHDFRESIADAAEAIHLAAELNCPTLVVCTGPRAGHTLNHARRLVKSALGDLLPLAIDKNVTLAVEPMHSGCAADWTFLNSLEDSLRLLDELDSPRVKMVFDTYHLGFGNLSLERIAQAAPRVALVQLGDARRPPVAEQNRCRLGEGVVPLKEIITALRAGGYDGFFDVELLGEDVEAADYHDLLQHAKAAFAELVVSG